MSSECDKCGEHCLDCECKCKNQFYFQGKMFDDSEEMFKYSEDWKTIPLDQETAERILDRLKKEILMNVFLIGKPMNNLDFSAYVERIFEFSMKNLTASEAKEILRNSE